jgi:hypothetical protein
MVKMMNMSCKEAIKPLENKPDIVLTIHDSDMNQLAMMKKLISAEFEWEDNATFVWLTRKKKEVSDA